MLALASIGRAFFVLRLEGKGAELRTAWLAALPLLLSACDHESHLAPRSAFDASEVASEVARARAVEDDFWQIERHEEATRPRLRHARSISLGFVGDAPLAGGVMRGD